MAGFDRWTSNENYTWAFQVFKKHHTYLNSLLWSHIPASEYVAETAKSQVVDMHTLFNVKEDDKRTIKKEFKDWNANYEEFNNWTRLSCLMSLSSYFEIYLATVTSMALESDPGQIHGATRKIDGVLLLKYSASYSDLSKQCTIGEWSKRTARYKALFNDTPPELKSNEGNLEKMRKLRNNIGHAFGRDIKKSREKGVKQIKAIETLSTKQLKEYLNVVYDVAVGIDRHLLKNHIGAYEIIYCFHKLKESFSSKHLSSERAAAIKKKVGKDGPGISKAYSVKLVDYYDKL